MHRLAVLALPAALLVALCTALGTAQEPGQDASPSSKSWMSRLVPFGKKEEVKAAPAAPKAAPAPPAPVESGVARRAREKATLDRRQAVCDKLREIAASNNDDGLRRMADQLEERAWEVYCQQTGLKAPSGEGFQSDEQTLAKHLPLRGSPAGQGSGAVAGRSPGGDSRTAARRGEP